MPYCKNRRGDNVYYRDHENRYYSCKDGSYQGRREPSNSGYFTDKYGNIAGYRGADGVFYGRDGTPRYKKY